MKNLILLIFILSTTSVNASVKSKIISNLISTENFKFKFQQKINEKIETGNCIISYPKKILSYQSKDQKAAIKFLKIQTQLI